MSERCEWLPHTGQDPAQTENGTFGFEMNNSRAVWRCQSRSEHQEVTVRVARAWNIGDSRITSSLAARRLEGGLGAWYTGHNLWPGAGGTGSGSRAPDTVQGLRIGPDALVQSQIRPGTHPEEGGADTWIVIRIVTTSEVRTPK